MIFNKVVATAILSLIIGGVVSGGVVHGIWIQTDRERLVEVNKELTIDKINLQSELMEKDADLVYLKTEALKDNVFLTDRPKLDQ